MIKRYFAVLVFFLIGLTHPFSQPLPCEDPPTMTSFCAEACIICDIDGFTGRHESTIVGEAPPGFAGECTIIAHNMQWIAFIAGSVNLSVQMEVSNCQMNLGLEFGLYKGLNCQNYERISNCFGGAAGIIGPGDSGTITNTEPLVIGQYYFIVMDGGLGDNCDWTFNVIDGSTQVSPLEDSGIIEGDDTVCPELAHQYFVNPPIGATFFDWTVNGILQTTQQDTFLNYTFPFNGIYEICVTAKNACDEGDPSCFEVNVQPVPVTEINGILCEGETYEIAGNSLTTGGYYEFDLLSEEGCDSLVTLDLTEIEMPVLNLDINICEGDTIFIGPTPYTQAGVYQEVLTSVFECDSIVNLDLATIICNITSSDNPIPAICHSEASGMIEFMVVNGTPPFTYSWIELNGNYSGSGNINGLGEMIVIDNIPAATYVITIEDGFGNFDIIITEVEEPPVLELTLTASDYNGVNVQCADGFDGSLLAQPSGGVAQYSYLWDIGQTTDFIDDLGPGEYFVTVTDDYGCTITGAYELTAPDPVLLIAEFRNPECAGPFTGNITAVQTLGGVGDYVFSLNNSNFTNNPVFDGLGAGIYTLEVMDGNGCLAELFDTLTAPQIPEIILPGNFEISLGELIHLDPSINDIDVLNSNWSSMESLPCPECIEQSLTPLDDAFYTFSVTSIDGCVDMDSVFVGVNKFRKIYIPNVFTPNFDGTNDHFTIFGGPEVASIRKLMIFNRWGALVFDGRDLASGIESEGWDGTYKGKDPNPDVYGWVAEIEFIDGEVLMYSGDIVLVK